MQKNRRSQKTVVPDYLSIGFTIYKVTESDMAKKPLGMEYFMYTPHAAKSPAYYNSREASSFISFIFNSFNLFFFVG